MFGAETRGQGAQDKANILSAIRTARDNDVSILCFPELCITGYGCEDAFHAPGVCETALSVLEEILPETQNLILSLGLPVQFSGGLFNAACLITDCRIVGFAAKQNLAGEGIHYEPRWFKPWPADTHAELEVGGQSHPLGDLIFDCGGVLIGFEICEDAWVADRPGRDLSAGGADVILNPSASHFAFGKQEIRRRFVLEGSRAFGVTYVYANLLGNEAGRAIYDGGTMIASRGQMLREGPRFSFRHDVLTTAIVDIDATRLQRARVNSFQPDVTDERSSPVRRAFQFPSIPPTAESATVAAWESGDSVKEEEFSRAVALGLFDYLRKSRSHGFVVSLSGGADSSSVATLVALAIRFAIDELGIDGLRQKLGYISELDGQLSPNEITRQLLTCVYQSTRNSSDTTRDAARALSAAIAAEFLEFDVDNIVQEYVQIVATGVGRELTWDRDDVALQNIQARARAPGVWMVANLRGALLLSTSNRSEAAVGYATMDGDTSGGLSPIAGIDKAFLRQWLAWMERQGPAGVGQVAALAEVNALQPTAELRPLSAGQTDEVDLMPYEVLDAIERAAIRDKHMPLDVFRLIEVQFAQFPREQLGVWTEKFFRLWTRNQWKRERYAPSFHLDDENLDPKTWCRFPILSGGFERELAELKSALLKPED
ncbi:MAG: NAD(+) synthase [Pirellulales bacterium]